jgi:hypothetical protein
MTSYLIRDPKVDLTTQIMGIVGGQVCGSALVDTIRPITYEHPIS